MIMWSLLRTFFLVIRSGLSIEIPIAEIVVGDICQVKYGDSIPADGILLQSNDLKVKKATDFKIFIFSLQD